MKKLFTLFVFCFCLLSVNAQNSSWNDEVQMFLEGFNEEANEMESEFTSMGLDAKVTSTYIEAKKQINIDIRFQETIWSLFNDSLMKEAKAGMIQGYQESYRTDPDFAKFVDEMKANHSSFLVSYSTLKDGKVLTKDFTITPEEIIN